MQPMENKQECRMLMLNNEVQRVEKKYESRALIQNSQGQSMGIRHDVQLSDNNK
jgi:hypothetical protein